MTLYVKHRPTNLIQLQGNENLKKEINSIFSNKKEDIPHAFLITGESGCGKTTVGRIIANLLGCKGFDYKEIDSADFRGIDTIRDIRKNMQYAPIESKCVVYLLDEAHSIGQGVGAKNVAQNALLKALEDTPKHVYFILCTTDPNLLISTIKGRCLSLEVNLLNVPDMVKLLNKISKKEKKEVPKEVLEQIAKNSNGQSRNAIQALERIINLKPDDMLTALQEQLVLENTSTELCQLLLKTDDWSKISKVLKGLKGQDPENVRRHVLNYMNAVLLNGNEKAFYVMDEFKDNFYSSGFAGVTLACYKSIFQEEE